jgi:PTH1 family peptidyl-tRNA hydrolase
LKLICGLGNPGNKYKYTRHNVGFLLLDLVSDDEGFSFSKDKKFKGQSYKGKLEGEDTLFMKPETFMNLSGDSILPSVSFFKLKVEDVIVIHDDVDLPFGTVKVKLGGGTAGHNGLKHIVSRIGNNFIRIRLGVGRPTPPLETADYVLQNFSREEVSALPEILDRANTSLRLIMTKGVKEAMNEVN